MSAKERKEENAQHFAEELARERERKKNSKHTRNINAARKKKKTAQNPNTN